MNPAPISEWATDERATITINDLLHMNSGLKWNEDYSKLSDVTKMLFLSADMTKSQIEKPFVGKPNAIVAAPELIKEENSTPWIRVKKEVCGPIFTGPETIVIFLC